MDEDIAVIREVMSVRLWSGITYERPKRDREEDQESLHEGVTF